MNFYGYLGKIGFIHGTHQFSKKEEGVKQVLLAALMIFMFQGMAIADDGDVNASEVEGVEKGTGKGKNFETRKAKALEGIAKRQGLLNELESCVNSANSREDMKSCKQKHKQAMKALHPEGMGKKERHMKRKDRKRERH